MMLPLESLFGWLNLAGIGVFAASGALAAARQRLDIVGACFFAIVTATGGGTLRDLLIDASVFWMIDPRPVVLCCTVAILVWGVPLRWWPERALEWLDAAGLAAFSVYGAGKALQAGFPPVPAIAAGVITASVGGVIRDIVAGVPSVLMRKEIYVTASLTSAFLFVFLSSIGMLAPWPSAAGFLVGLLCAGQPFDGSLNCLRIVGDEVLGLLKIETRLEKRINEMSLSFWIASQSAPTLNDQHGNEGATNVIRNEFRNL